MNEKKNTSEMKSIGEIMKMNIPTSGGRKKLDVTENCEICGKPKKIREPILGRVVAVLCDCDKERGRKEEAARQEQEEEDKRRKADADSFMDEKARSAVFESLTVDNDNRRYIKAAENYCNNWSENYRKNHGLLFYGGTGRGKTTLACCIANRLISKGVSVKAVSVNAVIQRIKDSFRNNGENGETVLKAEIKAAPLLILDDLGAEYKTEWSTTLLYDVIDARYRSGKPTIITTNLTLNQLKTHLTDNYGIPRAFDRLVEVLTPVEFQCRNYRAGQAKKLRAEYDFFADD